MRPGEGLAGSAKSGLGAAEGGSWEGGHTFLPTGSPPAPHQGWAGLRRAPPRPPAPTSMALTAGGSPAGRTINSSPAAPSQMPGLWFGGSWPGPCSELGGSTGTPSAGAPQVVPSPWGGPGGPGAAGKEGAQRRLGGGAFLKSHQMEPREERKLPPGGRGTVPGGPPGSVEPALPHLPGPQAAAGPAEGAEVKETGSRRG